MSQIEWSDTWGCEAETCGDDQVNDSLDQHAFFILKSGNSNKIDHQSKNDCSHQKLEEAKRKFSRGDSRGSGDLLIPWFQPLDTDFRLLPSRIVREWTFIVSSHQVCGNTRGYNTHGKRIQENWGSRSSNNLPKVLVNKWQSQDSNSVLSDASAQVLNTLLLLQRKQDSCSGE